ncbi:MAG: ABCB family ABC transporter ATP-binding protein/permease [Candidatus Gracilibacteria bacterium]
MNTNSEQKKTSLKTFYPYLFEYKGRVTIVFILMILAKVASVTAPLYLKQIVDFLQASITTTVVFSTLLFLIGVYFVLRALSAGLSEWKDFLFTKAEVNIVRKVSRDVFAHLHKLSLAFHLEKKTGALATKVTRGIGGIEFVFRFMLFTIVPTILEILFVVGILLANYHWSFTVVTLVTLIIYIFFTIYLTETRNKVNRELNMYSNEAQGKSIDSLTNFETVKYFTNETHEINRYDESLKSIADTNLKSKKFLYLLNFGQGFIITLGVVTLIYLASINVLDRAMTIGDFTLVTVYIAQLSIPLGFLGFVYRQIKESMVNMEDMFDLLNINADIADKPDAKNLEGFKEKVSFDHVHLSYQEEREILHNISFDIPKGKTVALVGSSGSGKTSLARLLFRFYDVTKGAILFDGQDIRDITQKSLRTQIGFVPQDTVLFNDSIFYNISYGKPGATKEEVYEAAKKANIHTFIESLPQGYETVVGERGLRLSGGEKQRVAIARVILKGSPILVFDEATSALDSKSENVIQDAIRALSKERTMLIIAHRLSTVAHADEILVLEHGEIKERGTHKELLEIGGVYEHLWHLQQAGKARDIEV